MSKDQNLINTFIPGDFVVYPSHGVGKIIGTEKRKIEETDLEYPIILAADGRVMDGMHRVCKALLEGKD